MKKLLYTLAFLIGFGILFTVMFDKQSNALEVLVNVKQEKIRDFSTEWVCEINGKKHNIIVKSQLDDTPLFTSFLVTKQPITLKGYVGNRDHQRYFFVLEIKE